MRLTLDMLPSPSELRRILQRLSDSHGDCSLHEIARIVAAFADARDVEFFRRDGDPVNTATTLAELCEQPFEIAVRFTILPRDRSATGISQFSEPRSRFRPLEPEAADPEARVDAFIREFARLETRNDFMWAGYVVRELLPRVGFSPDDAKDVLNRLRTDEIINVQRVANPRNPEYPATGVQLNHDNARVRTILGLDAPAPGVSPSP